MKLTLRPRERQYIINAAKDYEKKSGDKYSIRFVMLLLEERIAERFEEDIKEVFEEKTRLLEEEAQ